MSKERTYTHWDERIFSFLIFWHAGAWKTDFELLPFYHFSWMTWNSETHLEMQEGSWSHHLLIIHLYIPWNATAPEGLCWERLTLVFANASKGKVTATSEYLKYSMQTEWPPQKTNTSSVSWNKHGYSDKRGITSLWWTDRVHDPWLELPLKKICVLACHLLLFIPFCYFWYPKSTLSSSINSDTVIGSTSNNLSTDLLWG